MEQDNVNPSGGVHRRHASGTNSRTISRRSTGETTLEFTQEDFNAGTVFASLKKEDFHKEDRRAFQGKQKAISELLAGYQEKITSHDARISKYNTTIQGLAPDEETAQRNQAAIDAQKDFLRRAQTGKGNYIRRARATVTECKTFIEGYGCAGTIPKDRAITQDEIENIRVKIWSDWST